MIDYALTRRKVAEKDGRYSLLCQRATVWTITRPSMGGCDRCSDQDRGANAGMRRSHACLTYLGTSTYYTVLPIDACPEKMFAGWPEPLDSWFAHRWTALRTRRQLTTEFCLSHYAHTIFSNFHSGSIRIRWVPDAYRLLTLSRLNVLTPNG